MADGGGLSYPALACEVMGHFADDIPAGDLSQDDMGTLLV